MPASTTARLRCEFFFSVACVRVFWHDGAWSAAVNVVDVSAGGRVERVVPFSAQDAQEWRCVRLLIVLSRRVRGGGHPPRLVERDSRATDRRLALYTAGSPSTQVSRVVLPVSEGCRQRCTLPLSALDSFRSRLCCLRVPLTSTGHPTEASSPLRSSVTQRHPPPVLVIPPPFLVVQHEHRGRAERQG